MKYRIEYKVNSIILEMPDFYKLISLIEDQAKQEHKLATFRLECKDGISYESHEKEEYISLLRDNLNNINNFSLSLLGKNTTISFSYFDNQVKILIEATDRNIFLDTKEKIKRLLNNRSWNRASLFLCIIGFLFFIIISPKLFSENLDATSADIVFWGAMIVLGFCLLLLSFFYPGLVIVDGLKQTGRIFKRDLGRIIIIVITVIIIPILISILISKFL